MQICLHLLLIFFLVMKAVVCPKWGGEKTVCRASKSRNIQTNGQLVLISLSFVLRTAEKYGVNSITASQHDTYKTQLFPSVQSIPVSYWIYCCFLCAYMSEWPYFHQKLISENLPSVNLDYSLQAAPFNGTFFLLICVSRYFFFWKITLENQSAD